MESFWRSVGVQLGKQWKFVLAIVVAITVVLGIGATRIEFATGQDSYLNPDSQIAIDNVDFQNQFGGETVILLFTATEADADVADLIEGDNLVELEAVTEQLEAVANVRSVITPPVSITFSDALLQGPGRQALIAAAGRDTDGAAVRGADVTLSLARLGAIPDDRQVLGDPDWNDLLIYGNNNYEVVDGAVVTPAASDLVIRKSLASTFPNVEGRPVNSTAVGGVVLEGNLDLDAQSAATEELLTILETVELDGFELTVTGSPVYLKEINDYLKGGMLTLGLIAARRDGDRAGRHVPGPLAAAPAALGAVRCDLDLLDPRSGSVSTCRS